MKFKAMWQRLPKRLVSAVLSVALVAGMVLIGGVSSSVPASAQLNITPRPDAVFYVPEVIYLNLTARTGNMNSFKYYADIGTDGTVDPSRQKLTGTVYFALTGATNISVSAASGYDGTAPFTATLGPNGANNLSGGTLSTAIPDNTGTTIAWKATYDYKGRSYTQYAYSYVFAPSRTVVGAAARARGRDGGVGGTYFYCQSAFGIGGLHGGPVGGSYSATDKLWNMLLSGLHDGTNNANLIDSGVFLASGSGFPYSVNDAGSSTSSGNGSATATQTFSASNYITVDTSRYTNINQVPGMFGAVVMSDDQNSSTGYCDVMSSGNTTLQRTANFSTEVATAAWPSLFTVPLSGTGDEDMRFYAKVVTTRGSQTAANYLDVHICAKKVNKDNTRAAIRNAQKYSFYSGDFTSAVWTAYTTALKNAYQNLNDLKAAENTAYATLNDAVKNLNIKGMAVANHYDAENNAVIHTQEAKPYFYGDAVAGGFNTIPGYTAWKYDVKATANQFNYSGLLAGLSTGGMNYGGNQWVDPNKGTITLQRTSASDNYTGHYQLLSNFAVGQTYRITFLAKVSTDLAGNSPVDNCDVTSIFRNFIFEDADTPGQYDELCWSDAGNAATNLGGGYYSISMDFPIVENTNYMYFRFGMNSAFPASYFLTYESVTVTRTDLAWTGLTANNTDGGPYTYSPATLGAVQYDFYYKRNMYESEPSYRLVSPDGSSGYYAYIRAIPNNGLNNRTIGSVTFPTWTSFYAPPAPNGQDDLIWHPGSIFSGNGNDGYWRYQVLRSAHNNEGAEYITHIYVYDNAGVQAYNIQAVSVQFPYVKFIQNYNGSDNTELKVGYFGIGQLQNGNSLPASTDQWNTYAIAYGGELTRPGYTFLGWNENRNATTGDKNLRITNAANHDIYAIWSPNKYTVKYNANGGAGTMADTEVNYSGAVTLRTNTFTRTGYSFKGWSNTVNPVIDAGTDYTDEQTILGSGAWDATTTKTIYAVWKANTYEVKYNPNGGTGDMANSSHTYDVAKALTTNTFSRDGYTFAGWAKTEDGAVVYSNTQSVSNLTTTNGDIVELYAKWTANSYTINYDPNGGTGTAVPASTSATYDQNVEFAAQGSIERTGYTFLGWAKSASATTADYTAGSITSMPPNLVTSDSTMLYAVWSINPYTISYNMNSGTNHMSNPVGYNVETDTITLLNPSRDGYTFTGWTGNGTATPTVNLTLPKGSIGNKTFTANWTAKKYNVIYDLNKPANAATYPTFKEVDDQATYTHTEGATYDAAYTVNAGGLAAPTLTGYTFGGWKLGTATYNHSQSYGTWENANDTTTFVAQWTAKTYQVHYNANGGDGTMANSDHTYDVAKALTLIGFTRTGYTFKGWTKEAGAALDAEIDFSNTQSVMNLSTGTTVELYAVWTKLPYTLKFDPVGGIFPDNDPTRECEFGDLVTPPVPKKTGYVFLGWRFDKDGDDELDATLPTSSFNLGATHLSDASLENNETETTYYANWEAVKYRIAWILEGGTYNGNTDNPTFVDVPYGDTYENWMPETSGLFRQYFDFVGWYAKNEDGTVRCWIAGDTIVDENSLSELTMLMPGFVSTQFYAKWKYTGQYTIQYNYQGGKIGGNGGPATYSVYPDARFKAFEAVSPGDPDTNNMPDTANLFRTGYDFKGWYTQPNGEGGPIRINDIIGDTLPADHTQTTTYYADWTPVKYNVKYDLNAPDGTTPTGGGDSDVTYDKTYGDGTGTPEGVPTAACGGYTFLGWFTD